MIKVLVQLWSRLRVWLGEGRLPSSLIWLLVGSRSLCVIGLGASAPLWSVVGQRPSSDPCYVALSIRARMQNANWIREREGEGEKEWVPIRQKSQSWYNLTSEMTCHHVCQILLIRSKLLSPVHTQREGLYRAGVPGCKGLQSHFRRLSTTLALCIHLSIESNCRYQRLWWGKWLMGHLGECCAVWWS